MRHSWPMPKNIRPIVMAVLSVMALVPIWSLLAIRRFVGFLGLAAVVKDTREAPAGVIEIIRFIAAINEGWLIAFSGILTAYLVFSLYKSFSVLEYSKDVLRSLDGLNKKVDAFEGQYRVANARADALLRFNYYNEIVIPHIKSRIEHFQSLWKSTVESFSQDGKLMGDPTSIIIRHAAHDNTDGSAHPYHVAKSEVEKLTKNQTLTRDQIDLPDSLRHADCSKAWVWSYQEVELLKDAWRLRLQAAENLRLQYLSQSAVGLLPR